MKTSKWLAWIAALYVLALILPAFVANHDSTTYGFHCLILIPFVCLYPAWWANPLFFVGCGYLAAGNRRWAWRLGLAALLLAVSFGMMVGLKDIRIGYAVWMWAMVALVAAGLDRGPETFKPARVAEWDEIRADGWPGRHLDASASGPGASGSSTSRSSAPLSSRSPS